MLISMASIEVCIGESLDRRLYRSSKRSNAMINRPTISMICPDEYTIEYCRSDYRVDIDKESQFIRVARGQLLRIRGLRESCEIIDRRKTFYFDEFAVYEHQYMKFCDNMKAAMAVKPRQ